MTNLSPSVTLSSLLALFPCQQIFLMNIWESIVTKACMAESFLISLQGPEKRCSTCGISMHSLLLPCHSFVDQNACIHWMKYSMPSLALLWGRKHSSQRLLKPLSLNMHFISLYNLHTTFIWEGMCKMCADPLTYLCMFRQMRSRVSRRVRPHV